MSSFPDEDLPIKVSKISILKRSLHSVVYTFALEGNRISDFELFLTNLGRKKKQLPVILGRPPLLRSR